MNPLSREVFLQFKPATREVSIPGKGTVVVRELRASESAEFAKRHAASPPLAVGWMIFTVAEGTDGKPLFTEADISALSTLPQSVSDPIINACGELCHPEATPAGKPPPAGD